MAIQQEQKMKMGMSPRKAMASGLKKAYKMPKGYSMGASNLTNKTVKNPASSGNVKYHKY